MKSELKSEFEIARCILSLEADVSELNNIEVTNQLVEYYLSQFTRDQIKAKLDEYDIKLEAYYDRLD